MAQDLKQELEALKLEVADLRELIAKLSAPKVATAPAAPPAPKKAESVDESTMLVISAAIAAFLGKRATIKFVRPVKSAAVDGWRLQGRVAIHGSHSVR